MKSELRHELATSETPPGVLRRSQVAHVVLTVSAATKTVLFPARDGCRLLVNEKIDVRREFVAWHGSHD